MCFVESALTAVESDVSYFVAGARGKTWIGFDLRRS
jgi:hypothetical protein